MLRPIVWLAAGTLLLSSVQQTPAPATRTIKGFEELQAWSRQVHLHTPGTFDTAAREVAASSLEDLYAVKRDLEAITKTVARKLRISTYNNSPELDLAAVLTLRGGSMRGRQRTLRTEDVPALLGVSSAGIYLGELDLDFAASLRKLQVELNAFAKWAAMLEADIAILAPPRNDPRDRNAAQTLTWFNPVFRIDDGQGAGVDYAPVHWQLGRASLDLMGADLRADPIARLWYRATTAYQEAARSYGFAKPHLATAQYRLPDDGYFCFYAGVLAENTAAPPVQVFMQVAASTGRLRASPVADELARAERAFRDALGLEPDLTVAHLHLARVLGLTGRHAESVDELHRVLPQLTEPRDRYYAHLFLGAEEHMLEHVDEARAAYDISAALFPRAQSPQLGLAQVAWQRGDRAEARAAMQRLAGFPASAIERDDPWWDYDISSVSNAGALVTDLRSRMLKERER